MPPGEDWKNVKIDETPLQTKPATTPLPPPSPVQATAPIVTAPTTTNNKRLVGPVAKMMLNLYEIDSSKIVGTGPHGSIMKKY